MQEQPDLDTLKQVNEELDSMIDRLEEIARLTRLLPDLDYLRRLRNAADDLRGSLEDVASAQA
jgi:hypothetical protein